jgi:hypothetical protein
MLDSFKQRFYLNREISHLIANQKTALVFPSPLVGEGGGEGEHFLLVVKSPEEKKGGF